MEPELTSSQVVAAAGCSARQLHHWVATGALRPAVPPRGCGSRIGWTVDDATDARVATVLAALGATVEKISDAVLLTHGWYTGRVLVTADGSVLVVSQSPPEHDGWLVDVGRARDYVNERLGLAAAFA